MLILSSLLMLTGGSLLMVSALLLRAEADRVERAAMVRVAIK